MHFPYLDSRTTKISWFTSHLTCNTFLVSIVFPSLLPDLFMLEWPMDESLVSFSFLYFHSIPFILSLTTLNFYLLYHNSVQCSQSCLTICDPMDCSTLGFPVHHQLMELAQTHVHWFSDAIQPSHPLLSPSPPAFNLSQHQGLSQWVSSSHQVAKRLPNLYLHIYLSAECQIAPLKSIHG